MIPLPRPEVSVLLLLLACSESKLYATDADPSVDTDDTSADTGDTSTDTSDTSADTAPPGTCTVTPAPPRSTLRDTCEAGAGSTSADPWSLVEKWGAWPEGGNGLAGAVGDLDADGVPEVVALTIGDCGDLTVLDGATGEVEWRVSEPIDDVYTPLVVDLDADGLLEVVIQYFAEDTDRYRFALAVFDHAGTFLWDTDWGEGSKEYQGGAIGAADLDGDGHPELYGGGYVFDGQTGEMRIALDDVEGHGPVFPVMTPVDVEGDGTVEIAARNAVYEADGTLRWTCGSDATWTVASPLQADDDPAVELLFTTADAVTLCDDDGSERWTRINQWYPSPPALADFDLDGAPEIALVEAGIAYLLELDGTERWSRRVATQSELLASVSAWDLSGDGAPEVIVHGSDGLLLLDPWTGEVHAQYTGTRTPSFLSPALAVDVDGDGHGELVVNDYDGFSFRVVEPESDDWPATRGLWTQADYASTLVGDDGTPPPGFAPWWGVPGGVLRGQPSGELGPAANLGVAITDVCEAGCRGADEVEIALQVWNDGALEVPAGVIVTVTSEAGTVASWATTRALAPGESEETVIRTTHATVTGVLSARLGGDLPVECDGADDEATWTEVDCP